MAVNISIFRGDTSVIVVHATFTDSGGSTGNFNLTGSTQVMTIKAVGGSKIVLQKTGSIYGAATNGNIQFTIDPVDTASLTPSTYAYDVQVTGSDSSVYTVAKASFQIKEDVTT